ncbi:unnamed protein product [Rotaria sp. Silwood2]|nr:unnamed protein product [Rotaria sp. Silwood2]CAF4003609.1 unnamed protein product [Rotaria sp. Silwood2]
MRVQLLFILVLLAIIYEHQCEETTAEAPVEKDKNDSNGTKTNAMKDGNDNDEKKSDRDDNDDKKSDRDDNDEDSNEKRPSKYDDDDDQDIKPSRKQSKRRRKSPDYVGHMNIYLRGSSKGGKKPKPQRFRFPVARYDRRRFPPFGPLINFLPWLPIFVERRTKQTIIYSPQGGVYILPPVVNFYGKVYSVGQLIASGYASLVSTGGPPPPAVDVAPLVQTGAVVGPGVPTVNLATGGFSGAIQTSFGSFTVPSYSNLYGGMYGYQQQG